MRGCTGWFRWISRSSIAVICVAAACAFAPPALAQVVITEVHYDQASGEQEFVELYATAAVTLTGWTITDQDELTYVLGRPANPSFPCAGTFSLNAGDRVAIWQGAGTSVCTGTSRKIFMNRGTFLQRDGDDVALKNNSGTCRDYVAFETGSSVNPPPSGCTWSGPNPNNGNTEGRSISRFDVPIVDTNRGVDWERSGATTTTGPKTPGTVNMSNVVIACTSSGDCSDGNPCTDGTCQNPGTPQSVCVQTNNTASCDDSNACTNQDTCSNGVCVGGANVCSVAVSLNEVHYDQASNEQEFVELYATGGGSVDLNGWTLTDQDELTYVLGRAANPSFPCPGTFSLNAGDRLVIWQGAGTSVCTGTSRKIFINRGTFLQRDGDDVVLKNNAGVCRDYVAFESGSSVNPPPAGCAWTGPNPNNGNTIGRSISRFDVPFTDTDHGSDWERSGATTTTGPKSPGAVNVTAVIACASNAACDDANPCTSDVCTNPGTPQAACTHPANDAAACSDGSACTKHDVCQSGSCVGQDPVVCPAPDACHFAATCDGATGTCSNPRKPDGSACQVANACSFGADVCEFGVCVPAGNPVCATPIGGPTFTSAASASLQLGIADRSSSIESIARPEPLTPDERRLRAFAKDVARSRKSDDDREMRTSPPPPPDLNVIFDEFVGFWLLETIDDWNQATALEFYRTAGGGFRVKFYEGTQNDLREITDNDGSFGANPISRFGADIAVSVLGPRALRLHNMAQPGVELSSDDLASTVRIQDADTNILYGQFWTTWDGTGDDARYGAVENLSRYRRLAQPPTIQRNDQASSVDWSNPLEVFRFLHDYYALIGQTQKVEALHQVTYVGAAGYEALYNQFKTSAIVRSATTSTAQRGGGYIGVWRTRFPAQYPLTTIHTAAPHRFTPGSAVTISGFLGPYAVLNGVHHVPGTPPSTWTGNMPEPWQAEPSRQPYVFVDVDTSGIAVPYDPNLHGIGQLQTTHGPIAAGTEYRELVAALSDFLISAFGPGTHTRLLFWIRDDRMVPATFAELRQGLADDTIRFTSSLRTRDYASKGNPDLYWNPWIVGGSTATPEFNINDPFGLGFVASNPFFDHDIDLENYLDPASARNVFFTITGPTLPGEPITSQLTARGYPSNGSRVFFRTGAFATPPPDLVDGFGTHRFVPYGSADDNPSGNLYQYHFNLLGGLVKSELSCGRKIAYIRVGDEDAFDAPLYQLSMRSLAFGRSDMQSKVKSNWTAALAALLADLEAQAPDRYILDLRRNDGGFSYVGDAFAALFGGDRPGQEAVASLVHAGLDPGVTPLAGSGIVTGNDTLVANLAAAAHVATNEAAGVFSSAIVRGDANRRVDVILLTSTHAASGGDMFPHSFLGPNPGSRIHDLGHNVFARFVGDIDGRLWSGIKPFSGPGHDPLNPDLVDFFSQPRTPLYMASDSGLLYEDRHGTLVNPQTWTQPAALLRGWYDQTGWQDLGLIPPTVSYPLGICIKPLPSFGIPASWRDVWLEHAIVN